MAGPAIRYWEFAKALSKHHEVTLLVPAATDVTDHNFKLVSYERRLNPQHLRDTDVIITQQLDWKMAFIAKTQNIRIIVDAYDPLPLEGLELFKRLAPKEKRVKNRAVLNDLLLSFKMADAIICASEKQRDLWMGTLMSLGRITPEVYEGDTSLKNLLQVVPFGLPSWEPVKTGPGLRERFRFKENDKVILWAGGIWDWLDPLTLILAIKILSMERSDIKLVFMGLTHPNDSIAEMEMSRRALSLATDTGLIDRQVFFNYGWVPYDERQNFLLDADIGISMHSEHLETRYAFRTRILDYIWAGLPIIGTEGDSFADLIQTNHLGMVVSSNSSEAVVAAIRKIVDGDARIMKENLAKMRERFYWDNVIEPIKLLISNLMVQKRVRLTLSDLSLIVKSLMKRMNQVRIEKGSIFLILTIIKRVMRGVGLG
jgi:glycosyltransferase involved in cell wall biosynthesis